MRRLRAIALALLAGGAAVAGCAPATGQGTGSSYNRDLLRREDLEASQARTVRQAIEQLRPNWLLQRGRTSVLLTDGVVVYLQTSRIGGLEVLDQLLADDVEEIQHLDAATATNRFGQGHASGAIVLVPRKGR